MAEDEKKMKSKNCFNNIKLKKKPEAVETAKATLPEPEVRVTSITKLDEITSVSKKKTLTAKEQYSPVINCRSHTIIATYEDDQESDGRAE